MRVRDDVYVENPLSGRCVRVVANGRGRAEHLGRGRAEHLGHGRAATARWFNEQARSWRRSKEGNSLLTNAEGLNL